MPVLIPCRTDLDDYVMQIVLDSVTYALRFRWNTRESAWYMDVSTDTEEPLRNGLKVIINQPIGSRVVDERFPPGRFVAFDTTNSDIAPGETDLGDRVQLLYYSEEETLETITELEG